MKRSSWILKGMMLAGLMLMPWKMAHAEATKIIYSDEGRFLNHFHFVCPFNGPDYSEVDTTLSDVPEGKQSFRMKSQNGWAAFAVFTASTTANICEFAKIAEQDFSDYEDGHMRLLLKSTVTVKFEIEYKDGASNLKKSSEILSTGNLWKKIVIPLQTGGFGLTDTNLQNIRAVFIPSVASDVTIYMDHVRWTKKVDSLKAYPSSTKVNSRGNRQLTVEGRNNASAPEDAIILYSTYTPSSNVGTIKFSTPSPYAILKASTTDGTVQATEGGQTVDYTVDITTADLKDALGIFSESVSGVIFDTDSKLLQYNGGGASALTIDANEVSSDNQEGDKRVKITANQTAGFAGFTVQWGLTASSLTVKDMNRYYDGSIRFWFKGPSQLKDKVIIGIRSANVTAGKEYSKVTLSTNHVTDKSTDLFDDNWHPVVIPLAPLAKGSPWADLARTKILFNLAVEGNISGSRTFYLDNVRWDTTAPGEIHSMGVVPVKITLPLNLKKSFIAKGFDKDGVEVEPFPEVTWSVTGDVGTISKTSGTFTLLTATGVAKSGTVKAEITSLSISSAAAVTVANIVFTQNFNVYTDAGSGGFVGVSKGGGAGAKLDLSEQTGSQFDPPEGNSIRRSTYTLDDTSAGANDSFALWFTEQQNGSRFMRAYDEGYLHFWVKTARDLQISIRSDNITAGQEKSKFRLSELGVPTNNTWQEVWVALEDFKGKDSNLDFDQMKVFFAIGALSEQIGEVTDEVFDVDDVRWYTADPDVPSAAKVYVGLKEKQQSSGLVRSFETLDMAVTYDQALAAMAYTYEKDTALSKKVLDVFKEKYDGETPFLGFRDVYDVDTKAIQVSSRSVGPNAFVLLAAMHYKVVTSSSIYDSMIDGVANWIKGRQDADGAIKFGFAASGSARNEKSTEHNFDVYAAFKAFIDIKGGSSTFKTAMDNVRTWLDDEAYDSSEKRFNVGELANGTADTKKALDAYTLAPLALSSYTAVLDKIDADFGVTKKSDLTGADVAGYDFGGPNATPDKDAVWLEGTGQAALAFSKTGSTGTRNTVINEIEKTIVAISATGQGITYATNEGTGFGGFTMDSLNPAISSMAWYLFAKNDFNPFRPLPRVGATIRNISDNKSTTTINWNASVPTAWVRSDQYIEIETQRVTKDAWGIQIYTYNEDPTHDPRFGDPTPTVSTNTDSNPAGLILDLAGNTTTSVRLDMAWSAKDKLGAPPAESPISGQPNSFQWIIMKDSATPAIDIDGDGSTGGANDLPKFVAGADEVVVKKAAGLHTSQGNNFNVSVGPADYVYFEADFTTAGAQVTYKTFVILEFYLE